MAYTSAQAKGWRHEDKIRKTLNDFDGVCKRAPQSGAYTGEPDLTWTYANRIWTIDCKYGKDWQMKRHRNRLEGADFCCDNSARQIPLITAPLPKWLELLRLLTEPI